MPSPFSSGQFTRRAMRASMRRTSSLSPRVKNMPLLVRSGLSSSPPVWVCTVRERARRGRAASMSASHSSSLNSPPSTTTRGSDSVASPRTWRSPASRRNSEGDSLISGRRAATAWDRAGTTAGTTPAPRPSPRCRRCSRKLSSSAAAASSCRQPTFTMASSTDSGEKPATVCSTIQRRSSGVMVCTMVPPVMGQGFCSRRNTRRSVSDAAATKR
ncbi:hypothetical protein FQZ97_961440 [compost metagenome]